VRQNSRQTFVRQKLAEEFPVPSESKTIRLGMSAPWDETRGETDMPNCQSPAAPSDRRNPRTFLKPRFFAIMIGLSSVANIFFLTTRQRFPLFRVAKCN
jgi:hypothetical protein